MSFDLDYDQWIHLDAEELVETGIAAAYENLKPELLKYIQKAAQLEETIDRESPRYSVRCGDRDFTIYGPELPEESGNHCWGRATHAFFTIVNDQLATTDYRFFAINGDNDLGGMFLTLEQATAAQQGLSRKLDWPYLPTNDPPWYGRYH